MINYRSELVRQIASHDPLKQALTDGNGAVFNYQQLLEEINATVSKLNERGVDGLAILGDNSIAQVVLDVACLEAGIWTLQCPPFFSPEQISHALQASGCPAMVADQPTGTSSEEFLIAGRSMHFSAISKNSGKTSVVEGTAKVTFTSGSTGNPKGLCLSEAHLMAPAKALADVLSPFTLQRHLSVLPLAVLLETVAGIYNFLYSGACCIVPSLQQTTAASDIGAALHTLFETHQAHSAILVPELLNELIQHGETKNSALKSARFMAVGGSRVSDSLLHRAEVLGLPVYQGYGLSEAGSVVALNLPGANKMGTVGRALPHQQFDFAENGEIILKNPGFLGYCGEGFIGVDRSRSDEGSANGFATGDNGFLDEQGYLTINGRLKNVLINSMGRNISPEWVESTLLDQTIIDQVLVFGDAQAELSALVVTSESDEKIEAAVSTANTQLPVYARVTQWFRVPAFSAQNGLLTPNGKLRRPAILDAYTKSSQYNATE